MSSRIEYEKYCSVICKKKGNLILANVFMVISGDGDGVLVFGTLLVSLINATYISSCQCQSCVCQ